MRRSRWLWRDRDDDVRFGGKQFMDQRRKTIRLPFRTAHVNDEVAALYPSQLVETLSEGVVASTFTPCTAYQSNPHWFTRLLRLSGKRRGEERATLR